MTVTQDFGPFKRGDTIEAITITLSVNGAPPVSAIAGVAIDLRKGQTRYHRYDSADGSITIDGVDTFTIIPHELDIEGRKYCYDCQITFADGKKKTYFEGTWEVTEDITKDS